SGGGGGGKSASKSSTSTASTSASSRSDTSSSDTTGKSSSFTTTSSSSGHSSTSPDHLQHGGGAIGGGGGAGNPTTPSKSAGKSGKKSSLVRAFSSSKKEQQQQQQQQQSIHQQQQPLPPTPEDAQHYQQQQQMQQHARSAAMMQSSGVPPPIPSAAGLGPPTGGPYPNTPQTVAVSSSSSHRHASPSQGRKSSKGDRDRERERADTRLAAASPTTTSSSKRSKIAGLTGIPKTQSSSSKSSSKSPSSVPPSSSSQAIPSPSSGIPKPSASSSGKTKMSKEEKARAAAAAKEYNKSLYKDLPGMTLPKQITSGSKSSSSSSSHYQQQQQQQQASAYQQSHSHHHQQQQQAYAMRQQQQQQQQQHYSQTYPMPHQQQYPGYGSPHHQGGQEYQQYSAQHGYTPPYAHNPGYATPTRSAQPGSPLVQNVHPRVNMQTIERQQQQQQQLQQQQQQSHHHQHQQQSHQHQNKVDQTSAFAASSSSSTPSSSSAPSRSAQASHYVPVTIPAVNMDTHPSNSSGAGTSGSSPGGTGSRSMKQMLPQSPMMSPNMGRHNPSVNVVKPTISSATSQSGGSSQSSTLKSNKSDSNTQTNLSVLHRSVTPKQHLTSSNDHSGKSSPKPDGSLSKHESSKSRSSPSGSPSVSSKSGKSSTADRSLDNSQGSSTPSQSPAPQKRHVNSSSEKSSRKTSSKENILAATEGSSQAELDASMSSGIDKLSVKDSSSSSSAPSNNASDKFLSSSSSTTISPKLGVKMLGPHIPKNASNVAVVQPRPGEKMETTFDAEVRTETIQEMGKTASSTGKETTFLTPEKEEKTTFLDDAGEAMDIKPMQPIMRALPYGYFRGYTGYGGFSNRNFHIPGISVPTTAMYATRAATGSAQGLGLPRPMTDQSPSKYYPGHQMKRAGSSHNPASSSDDYASESDSYDYVSGYMSDGEILKTSSNYNGHYIIIAFRFLFVIVLLVFFHSLIFCYKIIFMQIQRFFKASAKIDSFLTSEQNNNVYRSFYNYFDDSSSISSGEISDTIAEISTDENLTGSSQGALSEQGPYNPYSSLKRGPHALHAGYLNPHGAAGGGAGGGGIASGRVPNLGTSAFMGTDYNSDSGIGGGGPGGSPWGRKYSLPQAGNNNDPNKLLSSDPSDYGYGYGWPSSRSDSGGVYSSMRKMSSGSNPDYAYHSEGDYDAPGPPAGNMHRRSFSPLPPPGGIKRDTETNTDQSHLLEASMRRLQTSASSGSGLGRNGGCGSNPPSSNGAGTQFGYRRSLSNASRDSLGSPTKGTPPSSSSSKNSPGSSAVGSRLAKHGIETINTQQMIMMMPPRPASASGRPMMHPDMMIEGGSGYHTSPSSATSTLERKRKNGNGNGNGAGGSLTSSKSTGCTQTPTQTPALPERGVDYQSNSLGRRRLFASGSKHAALCKSSSQDAGGPCQPGGVAGSPSGVGGTIISNPHATYGRSAVEQHHQQLLQQQATSHYVNMQELHARANYVSLDFPPSPRNSG
ncbi:hypothetical protein EGW08_011497, partial [Elysia chlorotica]